MLNHFAVHVRSPEESAFDQVELRFLLDGRDVAGEVFPDGPGPDPDDLLGPHSPLLPAEPKVVRLAEALCTWGCCGGVEVCVRIEGDQVVWDRWHDPDDPGLDLGEFRFNLARYTAELDRAHHMCAPPTRASRPAPSPDARVVRSGTACRTFRHRVSYVQAPRVVRSGTACCALRTPELVLVRVQAYTAQVASARASITLGVIDAAA